MKGVEGNMVLFHNKIFFKYFTGFIGNCSQALLCKTDARNNTSPSRW